MTDRTGKDASLLLDMPPAARDARAFVAGFDEAAFLVSRLHQSAVIGCPEVIGEAAGKMSAEFRTAHPAIPWHEITGLRHRLIHGYAEVRLDIVWSGVSEKLGPLIVTLEPLIPSEGAADE